MKRELSGQRKVNPRQLNRWPALLAAAGLALAGCSNAPVIPAPSEVPLGKETLELLAKKGMQPGSPVFVRIFKEESELEIWKQRDDGRFYHFKTYPICNWSGELGPKLVQGDKQAPEGFYSITPTLMNSNSKFYLSFNLGYPNSFDKSQGRTGDFGHGPWQMPFGWLLRNDRRIDGRNLWCHA